MVLKALGKLSEKMNHPVTKRVEAQVPLGDEVIRFSADIDDEPVQVQDLLPLFHDITNKVMSVTVQTTEAAGQRISCRSGCGACCSQLVPISRAEGFALLALVDGMPEERQRIVRARFAHNLKQFRDSGLNEVLECAFKENDRTELRRVGLDYFKLNLPCPFLEEQSCSIHPVRPISCREFLVVSDPRYCAEPSPKTTQHVTLPVQVSKVVYDMCYQHQGLVRGFLPMTLLYDQAAELRQEKPGVPASELVSEFLGRLIQVAQKTDD
jgi:Fe-S-cluster containining protein